MLESHDRNGGLANGLVGIACLFGHLVPRRVLGRITVCQRAFAPFIDLDLEYFLWMKYALNDSFRRWRMIARNYGATSKRNHCSRQKCYFSFRSVPLHIISIGPCTSAHPKKRPPSCMSRTLMRRSIFGSNVGQDFVEIVFFLWPPILSTPIYYCI